MALLAIVLWGLSFVATKAALAELRPIPLIVARFAMGIALLGALVVGRGQTRALVRAPWARLLLLGFCGVFVHMLLQAYALTMTSAVNTGWLIGVIPIWSAILAAIFLHERFTGLRVAGLVLGLAGALLVVTRGQVSGATLALPSTRGDLLVLVSTVNWAIYTVMARGLVSRVGALPATAGAMFAGWLLLLPFFFAGGGMSAYAHLSTRAWLAVVCLGIGCSGLGYLLWYAALERLAASQVAAFLYLEPLVTLAAAWAWLGEPVGVVTIVGGLLVLAGVALVQRPAGRAVAIRNSD